MEELYSWVLDLTKALQVPRCALAASTACTATPNLAEAGLTCGSLASMGLSADQHEAVCRKSIGSSSMKGNPIRLTHQELMALLAAAS